MIDMMMEAAHQEVLESKDLAHIIKGKRTKRPWPASPLTLMLTTSSSSSSHGESEGERERIININNMPSPSSSVELTEHSIGVEEDMANCLILLAQGHQNYKLPEPVTRRRRRRTTTISRKAEASATATAGGLYVYQCKTCNRCFPSFQALGGHRASHKKPKISNTNEEKRAFSVMEDEDIDHQINKMSTTLSLQIANKALLSSNNNIMKSNKVHQCSICGAEFSSGQALGGHMRRHRTFLSTSTTTATTTVGLDASSPESQESKKPRIISLELDLNLPAPEDTDARESKFHFSSKEQVLVFSASPLVDCHY